MSPSVAADAIGNFVVIWESSYQDGGSNGIFGQRFDSAGRPLGGEFRVNSYTTSTQGRPSVAAAADGSFVVVWHSLGQDGSDRGVFGQRYDGAGAAQLLEVSDRLYTAQVRATKATLPEEKVLALVQTLTYSAEAHLLTLEEGYRYVDRLTAALQPAEAWTDSTRRLESVATDWEARLSAARDVWARAGDVAEASGQVLRHVLEENRAALRWLIGMGALLAILSSVAGFWSWRTHALLAARAAVPALEAEPSDSRGPQPP